MARQLNALVHRSGQIMDRLPKSVLQSAKPEVQRLVQATQDHITQMQTFASNLVKKSGHNGLSLTVKGARNLPTEQEYEKEPEQWPKDIAEIASEIADRADFLEPLMMSRSGIDLTPLRTLALTVRKDIHQVRAIAYRDEYHRNANLKPPSTREVGEDPDTQAADRERRILAVGNAPDSGRYGDPVATLNQKLEEKAELSEEMAEIYRRAHQEVAPEGRCVVM